MRRQISAMVVILLAVAAERVNAQTIVRIDQEGGLTSTDGQRIAVPKGSYLEQLTELSDGRLEVRLNARVTGLLPAGTNVTVVAGAAAGNAIPGNMFGVAPPTMPGIINPKGPNPWKSVLEEMIRANPDALKDLKPLLDQQKLDPSQLNIRARGGS